MRPLHDTADRGSQLDFGFSVPTLCCAVQLERQHIRIRDREDMIGHARLKRTSARHVLRHRRVLRHPTPEIADASLMLRQQNALLQEMRRQRQILRQKVQGTSSRRKLSCATGHGGRRKATAACPRSCIGGASRGNQQEIRERR